MQPKEGNRSSQQNTGGESNPAHFSMNRISPRPRRERFAVPGRSEIPVKAAVCPLSVQLPGKLMQKIHTLTDN
jgi:hypothetical protein